VIFASVALFRSVPAVRISPLAAFKNFVMHCLLLYHFTTVIFASSSFFLSVPTKISPFSAFKNFVLHYKLLYHLTTEFIALLPLFRSVPALGISP
jgi:hypothetical protein